MASSNHLAQLAEVAILHASENFSLSLQDTSRDSDAHAAGKAFDLALRACSKAIESKTIPADEIESVIACYGALLGQWLVQHRNGDWVGLNEPVAPRVKVAHRLVCPHEAVRDHFREPDRFLSCSELLGSVDVWLGQENLSEQWPTKNRIAWDQLASDRRFTAFPVRLSRQEAESQLDPWLLSQGGVQGKRVLCLAAAGGTHGPLLAMAGAKVVVVDVSHSMLQMDVQAAERFGLDLQCIQSSMSDLSQVEPESIDVVIHPVSTCYVQQVIPVYRSVASVLKPNGLYLSQHKTPSILQSTGPSGLDQRYELSGSCVDGSPAPLPSSPSTSHSLLHPYREFGAYEFVHSIESLIGGLCHCGFLIEDIQEPPRGNAWATVGTAEHLASVVSPYIKIKARRFSTVVTRD